jgi:hypothetical protein
VPAVEPAPGDWVRGPVRDALGADDAHGERYRRVARRERPVEADPGAGADVEAE